MVASSPVLPTRWRGLIGVGAVANLVLAAGFALQQPWAVGLWPWETGRLSHLFLGSMLAAVGAGAAWIAASGETGSLPAGFLNLAVALGGIAGYLLLSVPEHRTLAVVVGVLALANVGLLLLSLRPPVPHSPPMPTLARGSYVAFAAVLVAVGLALILGVDGVMPWPVDPPTSAVFGWIFFGDAFYFAYAAARPSWGSGRAQLWSFLGYDVVLLVPLLLHLSDVDATLLPNLVVYLVVLAYSAVLGVYYLLIDPRTRGWGARSELAGTAPG